MPAVFPVSCIGVRHPVVTQDFRAPAHLGVDLMFPREPSDPGRQAGPGFHPRFAVPPGAIAVAADGGKVLYAKQARNGGRVRVAHSSGWHTVYLHLRTLLVSQGEHVAAGHALGELGADPTDPQGLVHLHFETRESLGVAGRGDLWGYGPFDPARLFGWPWEVR